MLQLNQVIAVVAGKKTRIRSLTEAHHSWTQETIHGFVKTYTPKDDEGDQLPAEGKIPELDVGKTITQVTDGLADFWDIVATQETGNTGATGSIIVGGDVLLEHVPVCVLLFLEKQLTDIHTFVKNLPTLPLGREWKYDPNRGYYRTESTDSLRTQKVPEPIVKYDATPEHPAQTELHMADKVVGTWSTQFFSTAIPTDERAAILKRVEDLQDAVKSAREKANSINVEPVKLGELLLGHIFQTKSAV